MNKVTVVAHESVKSHRRNRPAGLHRQVKINQYRRYESWVPLEYTVSQLKQGVARLWQLKPAKYQLWNCDEMLLDDWRLDFLGQQPTTFTLKKACSGATSMPQFSTATCSSTTSDPLSVQDQLLELFLFYALQNMSSKVLWITCYQFKDLLQKATIDSSFQKKKAQKLEFDTRVVLAFKSSVPDSSGAGANFDGFLDALIDVAGFMFPKLSSLELAFEKLTTQYVIPMHRREFEYTGVAASLSWTQIDEMLAKNKVRLITHRFAKTIGDLAASYSSTIGGSQHYRGLQFRQFSKFVLDIKPKATPLTTNDLCRVFLYCCRMEVQIQTQSETPHEAEDDIAAQEKTDADEGFKLHLNWIGEGEEDEEGDGDEAYSETSRASSVDPRALNALRQRELEQLTSVLNEGDGIYSFLVSELQRHAINKRVVDITSTIPQMLDIWAAAGQKYSQVLAHVDHSPPTKAAFLQRFGCSLFVFALQLMKSTTTVYRYEELYGLTNARVYGVKSDLWDDPNAAFTMDLAMKTLSLASGKLMQACLEFASQLESPALNHESGGDSGQQLSNVESANTSVDLPPNHAIREISRLFAERRRAPSSSSARKSFSNKKGIAECVVVLSGKITTETCGDLRNTKSPSGVRLEPEVVDVFPSNASIPGELSKFCFSDDVFLCDMPFPPKTFDIVLTGKRSDGRPGAGLKCAKWPNRESPVLDKLERYPTAQDAMEVLCPKTPLCLVKPSAVPNIPRVFSPALSPFDDGILGSNTDRVCLNPENILKSLLDFVSAPVPFFMGVRSDKRVDNLPSEGVIVVDLDKNEVLLPSNELIPSLPDMKAKKLLQALRKASAWASNQKSRDQFGRVDTKRELSSTDLKSVGQLDSLDPDIAQLCRRHDDLIEKWGELQSLFTAFAARLLKDFRKYCSETTPPKEPNEAIAFDKRSFLTMHPSVRELCTHLFQTQLFQRFVEKNASSSESGTGMEQEPSWLSVRSKSVMWKSSESVDESTKTPPRQLVQAPTPFPSSDTATQSSYTAVTAHKPEHSRDVSSIQRPRLQ
ncbi:Denn domain-containing protein 4c, partial [Globisporangium splendens]